MKNVLAVTARLKRCSIAISYENEIYETNKDIDAASNLVELADNLIKSNNIDLRKIEGIITASGPGSFTGIRAAHSFAKGLALTLKLPAASVSYFDVVKNIAALNMKNVAVAIKSEKGQVYYQTDEEFGICPHTSLEDKIKNAAALVGDAWIFCSSSLLNAKKAIYVDDFRRAKNLLSFSHLITQDSKIEPIYLSHSGNYENA
ncbi:MAG: tRNA (adenosine(37)-N6)-threonylcarbamoyltransferase complex dimerization subunit type 1 TsaB [Holosporaceae bacterium]|jgi:tRNA threonylcarbamoyl adenosine modification protein YeaZ|nr:tRNA (adenosine(37)-N6)-threonylcarbamoyltransferase complex dimerization subunit type 1 TsaB [Holosporaceae bacterium]